MAADDLNDEDRRMGEDGTLGNAYLDKAADAKSALRKIQEVQR